jgi:hypothetical protein
MTSTDDLFNGPPSREEFALAARIAVEDWQAAGVDVSALDGLVWASNPGGFLVSFDDGQRVHTATFDRERLRLALLTDDPVRHVREGRVPPYE